MTDEESTPNGARSRTRSQLTADLLFLTRLSCRLSSERRRSCSCRSAPNTMRVTTPHGLHRWSTFSRRPGSFRAKAKPTLGHTRCHSPTTSPTSSSTPTTSNDASDSPTPCSIPHVDPNPGEVIGCVYIYPVRDDASLDAKVSSWVRADHSDLDVELWRTVRDWLANDWPFNQIRYEPRDGSGTKD